MRSPQAVALGLFLSLASFTGAFGQCGTQAPANKFCGNDTGSPALATFKLIPPGGTTPIAGGTVLGNPTGGLALPIATGSPTLSGGPLTINPTASTINQGLAVNQTLPLGTASVGTSYSGNLISVVDNGYESPEGSTGDPTFGLLGVTSAFRVNYQSAGKGSPNIPIKIGATFATAATSAGQQLVGLNSTAYSNINSSGNDFLWGGIAYTHVGPSGNLHSVFGYDAEVSIATGATVPTRVGVMASSLGPVTGSSIDAAFAVTASPGVDGTPSPWTNAFLLWKSDGVTHPMSASGSVIITNDTFTANSFANLPTVTFTNNIFNFGASVFQTDGAGNTIMGGGSLTLGVAGTNVGKTLYKNATSGTITLIPATGALGSTNIVIPASSGTMAVAANAPVTLSALGFVGCATCVTSSGGGAITGTAPISVSAAGVVSINAPYATLTASNGGIVYSGATNLAILAGTATARQMLQSGASTTPAWSTATWPATTTINQLLYSSSANNVAGLATANSSILVTDSGGVPSLSTTLPAHTLGGTISGGGNQINNVIIGTTTPLAGNFTALSATSAVITSTSASAFAVGRLGATNPAFLVDDSVGSQAAGIKIVANQATGGAGIVVISSGTDETLGINAKGAGQILIGNVSTGTVVITPATTLSNALTYGGVTLANSVSGTGSMALTAGTTFTGTTTIATLAATTINAFTLAGTIAGGGNQLNNIIIGTTTPLAGTFTTLIANTSVSSPIHTSSGSHTFQSNGSTFAGGITTGQQWFFGTNTTPPANATLTLNKNAAALTAAVTANAVLQMGSADGANADIILESYAGFPSVRYQRANNTAASPTATVAGNNLGANFGYGYATTASAGPVSGAGVGFLFVQTEATCLTTACGARVDIFGTPAGTVAQAVAASFAAGVSIGPQADPGAGSAALNAQIFMPNITTSSAAQTGTVCWTTGTGKFTVDTTVGCLASIMGAKNITERLSPAKALDIISRLDPFAFRYKSGYGDGGHYEQFGLGAEEVATVDERLVGRDPEGAISGVRYQEMTAVLAGAIQQLKADNEMLRDKITSMMDRR